LTLLHRRGFLTAASAAAASAVRGANPEPSARTIPLRISLWPREGDGPIIAKDLVVTIDGAKAKVNRLGSLSDPLLLHIVVDLTGDLTFVDPAREALVSEIHKSKAAVSLLRAQDGLRVIEDPGTPKSKIEESLRGLTITGRAGLLDTIAPAVRLSDSVLRGARVRSAVLFVTDSVITNYREDYTNPVVNSSDANDMSRRFPEGLIKEKIRQIKEELASTLSPVFIVHLNYLHDRLNEAYQTGLLDLATATGGTTEFSRTPGDIATNIERVFARALSLQVAEVEAKAFRKPSPLKIAADFPGIQVQARPSYLPPAVPKKSTRESVAP
jgi:hypothetical protein